MTDSNSGSGPKRILVVGTGSIANKHALEFGKLSGCRLVGAADTNAARARAYADQHGIEHAFGSLEEAIAWGGFDAAVNSTPDGAHAATSLKLIAAGKAVFCEKPLATNEQDAFRMTEAVEAAGLVNMVNLTYRNAHALQRARAMVDAGEIGAVRHVEASYLQSWLSADHWGDWRTEERWLWRLSTAHGSNGVLGDIGVHLYDFVTFGTGLGVAALQSRLRTFPKHEGDRIGPYVLDANDSVATTAELTNGALAAVHMTRFATGNQNDLHLAVYGERGALKVWANQFTSSLDACLGADARTQTWVRLECPPTPRNEQRFVDALNGLGAADPTFRHAAEIQTLLDLTAEAGRQEKRLVVPRARRAEHGGEAVAQDGSGPAEAATGR